MDALKQNYTFMTSTCERLRLMQVQIVISTKICKDLRIVKGPIIKLDLQNILNLGRLGLLVDIVICSWFA